MNVENSYNEQAVEFLKSFIPNGLWILTAIDPEKKRNLETRTFSAATADQAVDWIGDRNGVDNLYFSVNQPEQGNYGKKLTKEEIAVVHYLHVDLDPEKGREIELQRKQIFRKLTSTRPEAIPRPSVIVDSGGGYQAFWRLEEPQLVENKAQREAVELFNIWLQDQLGGDNCHNLDRIMRLPWTVNKPNAVKQKAGRVEALAKPKQLEEVTYRLSDFSLEVPEPVEGDQDKPKPKKVDTKGIEDEITAEIHEGPIFIEEIKDFGREYGIPPRFLHIIVDGEGDDEEKLKKKQAGKEYSRSEWLFDVTCELERRRVPRRLILGILMEPNVEKFRISDSVINNKDYPSPLDYAVRQIRNAAKSVAEARLADDLIAEKMAGLDFEHRQEELYTLCRGERPTLDGVRTREEAEEVDKLLKALNKFLCVVRSVGGGKPRVVTFSERPEIGAGKMVTLDKTTFPEFALQYKGLTVQTGTTKGNGGDDPGKPITKPLTEWWIGHKFKNIKERITFAPEMTLPGVLNEWRGFTYPADPNGKYDLFLEHVKENICKGNEDHYRYIMQWCARMFQKPGSVGQVGLFLKGGSGTGKSVFAKILGNLLVSNFFETAQVKKLSNFNSVLRTTVLLFLDEPSLDPIQYDVLKKLMVNDTMDIEAKGYEQETVANCLHIIFASNHDQIAKLDADDRRLCALEVGDTRKNDDEYFSRVYEQLEENGNAGYKALFHFFRTMDLTGFKVGLFPKTDLLAEQKDLSLDYRQKWLLDRLEDGEIVQGEGLWPDEAAALAVYEDCLEYVGLQYKDRSKNSLGRFLTKTLGVKGQSISVRENGINRTVWGYLLPPLADARAKWEKIYGARDWQNVVTNIKEMKEPEPETNVTASKYKDSEDTPF